MAGNSDGIAKFKWQGLPPTTTALSRAFIVLITGLEAELDESVLDRVESNLHQLLVASHAHANDIGKPMSSEYECAHALVREWIDIQRQTLAEAAAQAEQDEADAELYEDEDEDEDED